MTTHQRTTIRYSTSFKQKVVQEIETEGLSINQARTRYGIKGGNTIALWIRNFGRNHLLNKVVIIQTMDEKNRLKELEKQIRELKIALADQHLKNTALETLIQTVNEHYQTDVKKI